MNACMASLPWLSSVIDSSTFASPSCSSSPLDSPSTYSSMQSCCACGSVDPPGTVIDWMASFTTALLLGLLVHAPSSTIEAAATRVEIV